MKTLFEKISGLTILVAIIICGLWMFYPRMKNAYNLASNISEVTAINKEILLELREIKVLLADKK